MLRPTAITRASGTSLTFSLTFPAWAGAPTSSALGFSVTAINCTTYFTLRRQTTF